MFEQTLSKCQELVRSQGGRKKFRFKNKLLSLDSTTISTCAWSCFRGPSFGEPKARSMHMFCWTTTIICRATR